MYWIRENSSKIRWDPPVDLPSFLIHKIVSYFIQFLKKKYIWLILNSIRRALFRSLAKKKKCWNKVYVSFYVCTWRVQAYTSMSKMRLPILHSLNLFYLGNSIRGVLINTHDWSGGKDIYGQSQSKAYSPFLQQVLPRITLMLRKKHPLSLSLCFLVHLRREHWIHSH